jgi:hypothetical protein
VNARDLDGRYADSPLHEWFNHLASSKGLCCSVADGEVVADPDWESRDGHYRVRLENKWVDVPDEALITEPNRVGPEKGPGLSKAWTKSLGRLDRREATRRSVATVPAPANATSECGF